MARVAFPDRVDNFNFTQTRAERNVYETGEKLNLLDLFYMIHELEKAYFALSGGTIASVDTTTTILQASISTLSANLVALTNQVATLPAYTEGPFVPNDSTGKNGDTHFDTRTAALGGQFVYSKRDGVWI